MNVSVYLSHKWFYLKIINQFIHNNRPVLELHQNEEHVMQQWPRS